MEILNTSKVLVKNNDGKFLVLRSSEWPENPVRSLQPDLPGGLIEENESPQTAVIRETQEEAGIKIVHSDTELVYTCSELYPRFSLNRFIFKSVVHDEPKVTLSWEHDKFWWKSYEELISLDWRNPYPEIFKYLARAGFLSNHL